MKSYTPSTKPASDLAADTHPIIAEGGIVAATSIARDPYATLDDLMVVVEALCPQWPARPLFKGRTVL